MPNSIFDSASKSTDNVTKSALGGNGFKPKPKKSRKGKKNDKSDDSTSTSSSRKKKPASGTRNPRGGSK